MGHLNLSFLNKPLRTFRQQEKIKNCIASGITVPKLYLLCWVSTKHLTFCSTQCLAYYFVYSRHLVNVYKVAQK
jgi:hypothetical protein